MRRTRVIPVILISEGGAYKTKQFDNPVYIGDPINAIRLFNDMEVDEICILDIDASKQGRGPDLELIRDLAGEAFMPLSYGGGITSIEQAGETLKSGVEKIIINSALITTPDIIRACATEFGSQSVVASIDTKKTLFSKQRVYNHVDGKASNISATELAKKVAEDGAGELLLNSVDRDGTLQGYDHDLIKQVTSAISIPVIACGGASGLADMRDAVESHASAVAAGSFFLFKGKRRGILINYPTEQELRQYLS